MRGSGYREVSIKLPDTSKFIKHEQSDLDNWQQSDDDPVLNDHRLLESTQQGQMIDNGVGTNQTNQSEQHYRTSTYYNIMQQSNQQANQNLSLSYQQHYANFHHQSRTNVECGGNNMSRNEKNASSEMEPSAQQGHHQQVQHSEQSTVGEPLATVLDPLQTRDRLGNWHASQTQGLLAAESFAYMSAYHQQQPVVQHHSHHHPLQNLHYDQSTQQLLSLDQPSANSANQSAIHYQVDLQHLSAINQPDSEHHTSPSSEYQVTEPLHNYSSTAAALYSSYTAANKVVMLQHQYNHHNHQYNGYSQHQQINDQRTHMIQDQSVMIHGHMSQENQSQHPIARPLEIKGSHWTQNQQMFQHSSSLAQISECEGDQGLQQISVRQNNPLECNTHRSADARSHLDRQNTSRNAQLAIPSPTLPPTISDVAGADSVTEKKTPSDSSASSTSSRMSSSSDSSVSSTASSSTKCAALTDSARSRGDKRLECGAQAREASETDTLSASRKTLVAKQTVRGRLATKETISAAKRGGSGNQQIEVGLLHKQRRTTNLATFGPVSIGSCHLSDNSISESATYKDADIEHTNTHIIVKNVCGGRPVELTNHELTTYAVKQLNKIMAGFPKDTIAKLKQRRRTLKNRGYAQNCRHKRLDHKNKLEQHNENLQAEVRDLRKSLSESQREIKRLSGLIKMHQAQVHNLSDDLQHDQARTSNALCLSDSRVTSH